MKVSQMQTNTRGYRVILRAHNDPDHLCLYDVEARTPEAAVGTATMLYWAQTTAEQQVPLSIERVIDLATGQTVERSTGPGY